MEGVPIIARVAHELVSGGGRDPRTNRSIVGFGVCGTARKRYEEQAVITSSSAT